MQIKLVKLRKINNLGVSLLLRLEPKLGRISLNKKIIIPRSHKIQQSLKLTSPYL